MSIKEIITKILSHLNTIGTIYTANWTATSSSSNGAILTDTLTLPKGQYIVTVSAPVASANMTIGLWDSIGSYGDRYFTYSRSYYASATWLVSLSAEATLNVRSAQSTSVTFTNASRYGKLKAMRVR